MAVARFYDQLVPAGVVARVLLRQLVDDGLQAARGHALHGLSGSGRVDELQGDGDRGHEVHVADVDE